MDIQLKDFLKTPTNADMLRIRKDDKDIFVGYKGLIYMNENEELMQETVQQFRAVPEIRHRRWKEMGLHAPLQPEETPQYSFSDLQMTLYYTIILKP